MNQKISRVLQSLLIFPFLISCDEFIEGTVIYNKGNFDTVEMQFYTRINRSDLESRVYRLEETALLDEFQDKFEKNESRLGSGQVSANFVIDSDSVVIIFNNERRFSFPNGSEPLNSAENTLFFQNEYYEISGSTIYTKTFTQQDYEDAEEI
ncbi:hypothetical protein BST97_00405 [Nonlabens spongiae]|uniref:Uncharacterized protein n=1 Tax=Nonlabens spongiae TaxID=331648 RepID=A0A1W6MG84_9FLAO|nr:hypothetical protein [Nonlabens spongiae]ARN76587.1 hypothetical protein BST97_00405 [Nonlabens spongiae]